MPTTTHPSATIPDLEPPVLLARDHPGAGLTRRARRGDLLRVSPGAYTSPPDPTAPAWSNRLHLARARMRAVAETTPADTVIGYLHAALVHGAPVGNPPEVVHVISPRGHDGTFEPRAMRRHTRILPPEDLVEVDGMLVTSPARTAVDCARTAGIVEGLVVADAMAAALARPDVRERSESQRRLDSARRSFLAILAREPGWRGNRRARTVLAATDGWAASRLESEARRACLALGLPRPILQYEIRRGWGTAYTDLAWRFDLPDGGTWVAHLEVDGRTKYDDIEAFFREKERESQIRADGDHLARVDATILGHGRLAEFRRRIAPIIPPHVRDSLVVDRAFLTPWEQRHPALLP